MDIVTFHKTADPVVDPDAHAAVLELSKLTLKELPDGPYVLTGHKWDTEE